MPNVVETGYLDEEYLEDPYLGGQVYWGIWSQVDRRIDTTRVVAMQIARMINDATHVVNSQIDQRIDGQEHTIMQQIELRVDAEHLVLSEIERITTDIHEVMSQVDRQVGAPSNAINTQIDQAIRALHIIAVQIQRQINATHTVFMQVERHINDHPRSQLHEIRRGTVLHIDHCEGYLEEAYLEGPYLTDTMCAKMRSQVDRQIGDLHTVKSQIEQRIDDTHPINVQVERRIDRLRNIKSQIERLRATVIRTQITQVLYNTTNLRILCDFSSRGVGGTNWTASSTEPGDFSVNNLNTDIVEQVWRSASGVKTGLSLVVDTEVVQGVFVDTLAILNHNMTTSASVVWQGSNDAGFATIGFTETLLSTATNIYWISPTLPTSSYRYWRFLINDNTNSADFIQWGTVVFGSASIFQGECFVDRVVRQTTHFADKIETEGFTNVSNDRALKFAVTLEFRNLAYNKGNYNRLREIFENDRTSLKCLWIPTPEYASRFAVFGKLVTIPAETHNVKGATLDYVDFEITVNEAL